MVARPYARVEDAPASPSEVQMSRTTSRTVATMWDEAAKYAVDELTKDARVSLDGAESLQPDGPVGQRALVDSGVPVEGKSDFVLDPHRWVQLGLLSLLALLSDWTCFATVAVPSEWMKLEGRDATELIDLFLFTNVTSCFLFTDFTRIFGLRKVVVAAALLMAAGCMLRSGIPFFQPLEMFPSYQLEMAGTMFVGFAQPFFQCSPPLLSATWFGADERALATATAINFNQIGIATAFIVGGLMANSPQGMHEYFNLITLCAVGCAGATAGWKWRLLPHYPLCEQRTVAPPPAAA